MAARKYEKYIIMQPKAGLEIDFFGPPAKLIQVSQVAYQDDDVIKGSFYAEGVWFIKAAGEISVHPHVHDFDEVLAFFGCDPQDPHNLHGEVEFWYDDEQYILTRSCIVYVPKGLKHCPLIFRKVDRPIFHFGTGQTAIYHGQKV
jgi:mannose-6-phosphate isomerase-like protein (cupin superfamily)